ncbi:MAG: 30S ribosomal protein S13 [bacterium]
MVRIIGVDLPGGKRVEIGLTYLYGIGRTLSNVILSKAKVKPDTKVRDLAEDEVLRIRDVMSAYKVEGDLRRDISGNIKRLIDIGTYRGSRHRKNLPCRGQRTSTNARTKRGKRKTVGKGKKEVTTKGDSDK